MRLPGVKQIDLETITGGEDVDVNGVALSYTLKCVYI